MALTIENSFVRGRKDAGFIPLRAAFGGTMIYHGLSKLKEERREQAGQMFEQLGLRPGKPLAVATGAAEVFAGIASVLGFLTRPAAIAVLVTQLVAIAKVHAKKGFDVTEGGFEYNLVLIAVALGLLVTGPGAFSLHEQLEHLAEGRGPRRFLRRARPSPLLRLLKLVK
ncbi:MAG: DoxX family protein [Myxococcales bacterium]